MNARTFAGCVALAILVGTAGAFLRPLTLTPVGNPVPGVGPVALAPWQGIGGTFVLVGDHQGDTVRNYRVDPATGALSIAGSLASGDGPSSIAVSRTSPYAVVSNLNDNTVHSLSIDRTTGALTPVGNAPSGGLGPTAIDVGFDNFVVVANQDSNRLDVLRLDPTTGGLTPVGSRQVGTAPTDVQFAGRRVLVGHRLSNDVHLLRMDQHGALYPIDTYSLGSRVSSVDWGLGGLIARAATFPEGEIHTFLPIFGHLIPLGSTPTGGDITDMVSNRGNVFVTGGIPARVAAFQIDFAGLQPNGEAPLTGLSSRTLAAVQAGDNNFLVVNEYNNNQTLVFRVE